MYAQLLLEELEGISPEAKFFLLKFLQDYWDGHVVSVSNKDLLEGFGIYDRSVKRILTELLAKKYLGLEKRLTGARGRPKQALIKGEALQEIIEKWKIESVFINHEQSIAKLLEVTAGREQIVKQHGPSSLDRYNTRKPAKSRVLTNIRKLLLCVLLAKADQFGVVRNLGMTELASLIGLSKEQLRWHLKILKGSQFLIGYVSGRSFRGVKGKLKSTFILRLGRFVEGGHPKYEGHIIRSEMLSQFGRTPNLADFFDVDDSGVRRIGELICELTTAILAAPEGDALDNGMSREDVIGKVAREVEKRGLGIAGIRSGGINGLTLLSKAVWKLYEEVSHFVRNMSAKGQPRQIGSCILEPLMGGTSEIIIFLLEVESDNNDNSPSLT
jgi:hypothetical protein